MFRDYTYTQDFIDLVDELTDEYIMLSVRVQTGRAGILNKAITRMNTMERHVTELWATISNAREAKRIAEEDYQQMREAVTEFKTFVRRW